MSIDLSLERIRKLYSHLPPYTRPTFHIAGTNGKGSVSALITSILLTSSPPYRVGRFNSPHLISIYDCITIDGEPVSPDVYSFVRSQVEKADQDHTTNASSFELLTLTALQIFERKGVDIAVIEVGMGGRLDATNVIPDECVLVSALTAVDLDHQAFLGNTVSEIASEKAAIARKGKPFVLGKQKHVEVQDVVENIARAVGGVFIPTIEPKVLSSNGVSTSTSTTFSLNSESLLHPQYQEVAISLPCFSTGFNASLPLQGEHQVANLGIALTAISAFISHSPDLQISSSQTQARITPQTICRGLKSVSWPGRLSFHKISHSITKPTNTPNLTSSISCDLPVLVDGAHNPASSETLASYLRSLVHRALLGMSTDSPTDHPRDFTFTFLLALSHSPPKTPRQTMAPLLPLDVPNVRIQYNLGLLRFTPPEGMPWVKSVPPSELRSVTSDLVPSANLWSVADDDPPQGQMRSALNWACSQHVTHDGTVVEGLIVIAGSLYLVADFYRILSEAGS